VEPGEQLVCFFASDQAYQIKLLEELDGLTFGSGSSLFSGKTGKKLFGESFTVLQSRADADEVYCPFFDIEGSVNQGERVPLIEDGVIRRAYTCRRYARKYELPLTGAAGGEYDAVPDLEPPSLVVRDSGKTIAELLDGRKAILVYFAAGGDFTPDGAFATPVQSAYVYDGERLLGKAPELAVSSHLYRMFGDDFVGVSSDNVFPDTPSQVIVMKMKVDV
jgi:PmbA protein